MTSKTALKLNSNLKSTLFSRFATAERDGRKFLLAVCDEGYVHSQEFDD